jgi:hypothetical protein
MKKSEAIIELSKKLSKQDGLLQGYFNGNVEKKCLYDNLSIRILDYLTFELGMLPPVNPNLGIDDSTSTDDNLACYYDWEEEETDD